MTELLTTASRPVTLKSPRRRWAAPALVGIAGAAVSAIAIGQPSVWYDEAATVSSATRSWSQLAAELGTVDLVHGLYYALMHVWFDVVGYSPLTLRLPSAIAVGIAAALVVVLGRQLSRERFGVVAGIVFLLLPRTTWAGGEGRSYALTAALAVGTAVILVVAVRTRSRRWWIVYGIAGVIACLGFTYLALVLAAQLVSLIWLRRRDRRLTSALLTWLAVAGTAALALSPFLVATAAQRGQVAWLPALSLDTFRDVVSNQWFFAGPAWTIVGWIALAAGTGVLLTRRPFRWVAAIALPGLIVPTAAILLASAAVTPLYNPRYLTMSLPFVALVIAAAFELLPRRRLAIAALAALVAISVPTLIDQRQATSKENTDWSAVSQLIATQRADDGAGSVAAIVYDRVRYHPRATARVIAYAYPAGFEGTLDVTLQTSAAESGRLWEYTAPLAESLASLDTADVTYLITSIASDGTAEAAGDLDALGWRITDDWVLSDVKVVRFARG